MENLGGWDQTEDHPDFDPNLLNVESWNVDHQQDDDQLPVDPHDGRQRKKSWGNSSQQVAIDQWSASLGVSDFEPNQVGNPSQQPQGVTMKQGTSSAPVVGNHPMSNTVNTTTNTRTSSNMHRVVGIPTETVEAAVEAAVAAISEPSDSVATGDRSGGSSNNNPNRGMTRHLHPLGIQSSASCPAPAHSSGQAFPQQPQVQQQHIQQRQQVPLHHHHHQQGQQQQPQQPHKLQASAATTTTPTTTNSIPASAQHLTSLQANFMLAQAANSSVAPTAAAAAAAGATNPATVISQPSTKTPTAARRRGGTRAKVAPATKSTKKKKANAGTAAASGTVATGDATATAAAAAAAASGTLPPFYLFDAPIELRANFMQNQRRLGLPIQHDPNSYHYGETVNGFHPHQYQLPFGANSSNAAVSAASGNVLRPANLPPPQLIDARHGNHRKTKGGQVKNEREQKRAQKITELIEQLRLQMEDGGWQVEARSKFHTLSK